MKNSTYKKLFDFYQNEQGVYTILTALISFVLLSIIALAVDGSGMLLDKARLSQGLEQGALALTAEANKPRLSDNEDLSQHKYLDVQSGSATDIGESASQLSDQSLNGLKAYQRDQQLLKGYVQSYLPDADVKRDFKYNCEQTFNPKRVVSCWAYGDIDRNSWLPLNGTSLTFKPKEKIASEQVFVGKTLDDIAPLDLMLVTDLSGSMADDEQGRSLTTSGHGKSKIEILREVVSTIGEELLDNKDKRKDISPYNRIRFTSFAFGGTQQDNGQCYLPYKLTTTGKNRLLTEKIQIQNMDSWYRWSIDTYGRTLFETWKWWIYSKNSELNNKYFTTQQIYKRFLSELEQGIDYPSTVSNIGSFTGKKESYDLVFNKNPWCLDKNQNVETTSDWYEENGAKQLKDDLAKLKPSGATLSSSGMLIGANLLMDTNKKDGAKPDTLRTNTQRILLVLSDGRDEIFPRTSDQVTKGLIPSELTITKKLIDKGMCDKIREKLNNLQNNKYPKKEAKIHFVAFGYELDGEQEKAWKKCVGDAGYHEAKNKEQLLETFRQIVKSSEEVGHVTPNRAF